jgi:glutamine synthetase adenylyltransferase
MTLEQRELFDCGAATLPSPAARRASSSTSREAAARSKDLASRHAALVLDALRTAGQASAEQIAVDLLGGALTTLQVMKRLSDLLKAKRVLVHDEDGRNRSGRRCRRYRLAGVVFSFTREVRL